MIVLRLKYQALTYIFLCCMSFLFLSSCSNSDYQNAIPGNVTALVKFDARLMSSDKVSSVVSSVLSVDDADNIGVDFTNDLFAFETIDGNIGFCAKVRKSKDITNFFERQSANGKCSKPRKQGDFYLTDLNASWAVGYSDNAFLILGPVSPSAIGDAQRSIVKWLKQDIERSVVSKPIFGRLDSLKSAVGMVAQLQALPEKFVAPFALGVPKGVDNSQIMLSAKLSINDNLLVVDGETFSTTPSIDNQLKSAKAIFRPIVGTFTNMMPQNYMFGMFMNVDGTKFLPILQNNKPLQAMLVGLNTAIDFDNILRSVNGDLAIMTSSFASSGLDMSMFAKLGHANWTSDVEYWKQSCPAGSSLSGNDREWHYVSGSTDFCFGLFGDNEFYGTTNRALNPNIVGRKPIVHISDALQKAISDKRMVMVVNVPSILGVDVVPDGMEKLTSVFGDVKSIMISIH